MTEDGNIEKIIHRKMKISRKKMHRRWKYTEKKIWKDANIFHQENKMREDRTILKKNIWKNENIKKKRRQKMEIYRKNMTEGWKLKK